MKNKAFNFFLFAALFFLVILFVDRLNVENRVHFIIKVTEKYRNKHGVIPSEQEFPLMSRDLYANCDSFDNNPGWGRCYYVRSDDKGNYAISVFGFFLKLTITRILTLLNFNFRLMGLINH